MARATAAKVYDCMSCGACCYNPDDNREIDYIDYIEIEVTDRVMKKPELVRRLVVLDDNLVPHMKLDHHQRCVALKGQLGVKVGCTIYHDRPSGCRSFTAGSKRCKQYRKERGIDA
ncbi:MAG: YkgJ family cysteine cluster protein [Polyangiales bacterium]